MIFGGSLWFLVVLCNFLVVLGDFLWFLMVLGGTLWLLVVLAGTTKSH